MLLLAPAFVSFKQPGQKQGSYYDDTQQHITMVSPQMSAKRAKGSS